MSLTNFLVPTYTQMLQAMSNWLEKARIQSPDTADALMSARLAPDMFPLSSQIRFACVQAQEAIYRLQDQPFSEGLKTLTQEGQNAGDTPGTLAEAQTRISETLDLLNALAPDAFDAAAKRMIAHEVPNGMIFDMDGERYARDWNISQFYFHLMTAYAIMRNQGIELGKADYVQHPFSCIRPESMPKG